MEYCNVVVETVPSALVEAVALAEICLAVGGGRYSH